MVLARIKEYAVLAVVFAGGIIGGVVGYQVAPRSTVQDVMEKKRMAGYGPNDIENFSHVEKMLETIDATLSDDFISEQELFGPEGVEVKYTHWNRSRWGEFAFFRPPTDGMTIAYRKVHPEDNYFAHMQDLITKSREAVQYITQTIDGLSKLRGNKALSPDDQSRLDDLVTDIKSRNLDLRFGVRGDSELGTAIKKTLHDYRTFLQNLEENDYVAVLVQNELDKQHERDTVGGVIWGSLGGGFVGSIVSALLFLTGADARESNESKPPQDKPVATGK